MSKQVLIVGAGVIGLFCALRLAKAGAKVILFEGERDDFTVYGPTASLAAAGMLSPLVETTGDADGQSLALQSFDLWRAQSKGALWEDGLRFDGAVAVSDDPAATQARVREAGRNAIALNASQWRKRTGFDARIDTGVFVEDEGIADPIRVLSGLAMDARRHGVQTLFAHDVGEVTANTVETYEEGVFEADAVLLAPGVWSTPELKAAAPALELVRPAKGQLVPVKLQRSLGPNLHTPDFYLARRMNDDVVLGATMELGVGDRHATDKAGEPLLAAAERLLPGAVARQERGWAGVRPMSPDGAPMVGRSGDVWIAAGHSRNGWLLAPITAEIATAQIMGDPLDPLWQRYSPDRFNT
jgi:glycine oxidase